MTDPMREREAFETWDDEVGLGFIMREPNQTPEQHTLETMKDCAWQGFRAGALAEREKALALVGELLDTLKLCQKDYGGVLKICRHYALEDSYKDAQESKVFIERSITKAQAFMEGK